MTKTQKAQAAMHNLATPVLLAAATGQVNLTVLAKYELATRGIGTAGICVGRAPAMIAWGFHREGLAIGMHAYWKDRGRVIIRRLPAAVDYAIVRFDCGDRPLSPEHQAPLSELVVTKDGWKE